MIFFWRETKHSAVNGKEEEKKWNQFRNSISHSIPFASQLNTSCEMIMMIVRFILKSIWFDIMRKSWMQQPTILFFLCFFPYFSLLARFQQHQWKNYNENNTIFPLIYDGQPDVTCTTKKIASNKNKPLSIYLTIPLSQSRYTSISTIYIYIILRNEI